jgi:hypothetical protein
VQRHDRDGVEIGVLLDHVHDQRDVLEEAAHGLELSIERISSFRLSRRPGASADLSFFHMSV